MDNSDIPGAQVQEANTDTSIAIFIQPKSFDALDTELQL